ncbi:anaerobic sulfatase maturase [Rahnella victoriana]|uniref:Anaerobic sulfatase maturase n=1 Tax=Rahnella victoriana TaxID=1510570 RepID=A0ABS0E340_9GAMM|nr:anaerobic sulfatase maturase [Rahnella victoriana]MBF7958748.1 anaerobic sulfatase maturase [Rahnella victoriana]
MKKPFHIIAKPTGSQCNLSCEYCFYLGKEQSIRNIVKKSNRHMNDETLRSFVKQYIAASPLHEVEFIWQGGEPTLAGIPFFKRVLFWQSTYAGNKKIRNSIQTNGVLINDEWGKFLAKNHFLVGISIDGPKEIHDFYRYANSGRTSFDRVMQAVTVLKKYQIEFNVLTTVNSVNCHSPLAVYHFITQELGASYVQFIPIVEQYAPTTAPDNTLYPPAKKLADWSVTGEAWGQFIIAIFDYWVTHDVGQKFVQLFDNIFAVWIGEKPSLCVMNASCGQGLVLEQNGDIFSCDHYVYPSHKLGNINTDDLDRMVYGKKQRQFGLAKLNVARACYYCEWLRFCNGGCPKHRISRDENLGNNHLCKGYQAMFSHMAPYMEHMSKLLAQHRAPADIMNIAASIQH